MKYQIWYMRPAFFSDGIMGKLPNIANLSATHVHLKDIEANGLGAAYNEMQGEIWSPNGEARELIKDKGLEHTSMSVGDVLIDDVGNAHVVCNTGLNSIGGFKPKMSWQDKAIAATRGTQLGAIIACILKREIAAPYFTGKASITSDGFIMCDFVNRNGEGHDCAFVGSFSDLKENAAGLAKHLKLTDDELDAFADMFGDWIGQDYRGGSKTQLRIAIASGEVA